MSLTALFGYLSDKTPKIRKNINGYFKKLKICANRFAMICHSQPELKILRGKRDSMKQIPTMTPEQAANRLRELGMRTSPARIRQGIRDGVYPFGVAIRVSDRRIEYEIYGKQLDDWIEQRAIDLEHREK